MSDDEAGTDLYELVSSVYPLPRSLTGPGVEQTLALLQERVPLQVRTVPTGTPVFDWTVPPVWTVREAWLADPAGRRVVDVADHPLHLLGYSTPMTGSVTLDELRPHLFSLPDRPDAIPFRTSYYNPNWGFCLTDRALQALPDGRYQVHIDTSLEAGALTYGELLVPGAEEREVLITTHICHPAMANDNATGLAVATKLAEHVLGTPGGTRYSYRFLFIPGTIGSITWLATSEDVWPRVAHGIVLTGLGDSNPLTWKRSRQGSATIDRAVAQVLRDRGSEHRLRDFSPYGYDERQFCSPGIDLPVGRFGRGQHGEYPEYHTSADDLDFISAEALGDAFAALVEVLATLERDRTYLSTNPHGEAQLGKRGLYRSVGFGLDAKAVEMGFLWVMNLADGEHSLLDMAERSGMRFAEVAAAADALLRAGLLRDPLT